MVMKANFRENKLLHLKISWVVVMNIFIKSLLQNILSLLRHEILSFKATKLDMQKNETNMLDSESYG